MSFPFSPLEIHSGTREGFPCSAMHCKYPKMGEEGERVGGKRLASLREEKRKGTSVHDETLLDRKRDEGERTR